MNATAEVDEFWSECRRALSGLPEDAPEAWAFGATPVHADDLLALVRDGVKTATSSSGWDYEHSGERIPQPGDLSIILDGAGAPRALLETTEVSVHAFDEVSAEHAHAEGEDDRTLASWRFEHERYWRNYSENPKGFAPSMPVICERFTLLYPVEASQP